VFVRTYSCLFLLFVFVRTYSCLFVHIRVYSDIFVFVRTYSCLFGHIRVCSYIFMFVRTYSCLFLLFVFVRTYSCLFGHIRTYSCLFVHIRVGSEGSSDDNLSRGPELHYNKMSRENFVMQIIRPCLSVARNFIRVYNFKERRGRCLELSIDVSSLSGLHVTNFVQRSRKNVLQLFVA
jgi:hypothetical protein